MRPVNDNTPEPTLPWSLRGPDEDGLVWLDHDAKGAFNLGDKAAVHTVLAGACAAVDFGADLEFPDGLDWKLVIPAKGGRFAILWRDGSLLETVDLGPREAVCAGFVEWLVEVGEE